MQGNANQGNLQVPGLPDDSVDGDFLVRNLAGGGVNVRALRQVVVDKKDRGIGTGKETIVIKFMSPVAFGFDKNSLKSEDEELLLSRFTRVTRATLKGTFLIGFIQCQFANR